MGARPRRAVCADACSDRDWHLDCRRRRVAVREEIYRRQWKPDHAVVVSIGKTIAMPKRVTGPPRHRSKKFFALAYGFFPSRLRFPMQTEVLPYMLWTLFVVLLLAWLICLV